MEPFVQFRMIVEATKKFQVAHVQKGFNILTEENQPWMTLLSLRGSDGKADHTVAITSGWIFDSNFERGLRLSQESLDLCCSSDDAQATYAGIRRGWTVIYQPRPAKRRQRGPRGKRKRNR